MEALPVNHDIEVHHDVPLFMYEPLLVTAAGTV